jgi:hypothetical protein
MSEEVVEISKSDMIIKAVTSASAPVVLFLIVFLGILYLAAIGYLTPEQFLSALGANGLVSAVLKLVKE